MRAAPSRPVRPRSAGGRCVGRTHDGDPLALRPRSQRHSRGGMNPVPLVAVAGNPNAGKSALFNALTGARQKVGNYPGVTVERHVRQADAARRLAGRAGRPARRLRASTHQSGRSGHPRRPAGRAEGRAAPGAADRPRCVRSLDNHLRFSAAADRLGLPTVVALNMVDMAKRDGLEPRCRAALGRSSACRWSKRSRSGSAACRRCMERLRQLLQAPRNHARARAAQPRPAWASSAAPARSPWRPSSGRGRRAATDRPPLDGCCFIRWPARLTGLARHHVRHVPGGLRLVASPAGCVGRRDVRRLGQAIPANALPDGVVLRTPDRRRRVCRRWRGDRSSCRRS